MKRKRLVLRVFLLPLGMVVLLSTCNDLHSQTSDSIAPTSTSDGAAGLFLRMGVGARALGMGNAFTGLANDASATYWNPAGLYQIREYQLEAMNVRMPLNRSYTFVSGVIPFRDGLTFGLSWIGLNVDGIEGRTSNTASPDFLFSSSQNAFMLSVAKPLYDNIVFGGNIKILQTQLHNSSGSGLGFDVALFYKPSTAWSLGVVAQDLASNLSWQDLYAETIPMTWRVGTAFQVNNGIKVVVDIQKTKGQQERFNMGAEIRLHPALPLRLGFDNEQITGGAGFSFQLSGKTLDLNYGYVNDHLFNQAIHRLSAVLTFGRSSSSRRRPETALLPTLKNSFIEKSKASESLGTAAVRIRIKANRLNVRSGPGTGYRKIARVKRGERFQSFERNGQWRKIRLSDALYGWVHQDYVEFL